MVDLISASTVNLSWWDLENGLIDKLCHIDRFQKVANLKSYNISYNMPFFFFFLIKYQISATEYYNQSETEIGDKKLLIELYVTLVLKQLIKKKTSKKPEKQIRV